MQYYNLNNKPIKYSTVVLKIRLHHPKVTRKVFSLTSRHQLDNRLGASILRLIRKTAKDSINVQMCMWMFSRGG